MLNEFNTSEIIELVFLNTDDTIAGYFSFDRSKFTELTTELISIIETRFFKNKQFCLKTFVVDKKNNYMFKYIYTFKEKRNEKYKKSKTV